MFLQRSIVMFTAAAAASLAAATAFAQPGSQYITTPVTDAPVSHRWPSLNDGGDRVWSVQVDGYWQVFRNGVQVTNGSRNHESPTVSNSGDLLYFVDGTGGGIGYQVLRRSASGSESVVEVSTRNNATGDRRDAGRFFGMASNGTSISSYTFFRGFGTRRFNVSGLGELTDGFGGRGDFSLYDFPDINSNGHIVYASEGNAGTSRIYRASTAFPFTQTALGVGQFPRIADGTDPEVVFVRDGIVVSTKGGDVGSGLWADVNGSGTVLLERQVDGVSQIFSARRCTVDLARPYSQVDPIWKTEPYGHNPFANGPDDLPLIACPRPNRDRTIGGFGCLLTSVSMALNQVGVTQLPLDGALVENNPQNLNRFMKRTSDGYQCRDVVIANVVHHVDQAVHPGAAKLIFRDMRSSNFNSELDEARARAELDRILCDERLPVIVRVPSSPFHFVVVTGRREQPDGTVAYTLADPGTIAVGSRKLDHYRSFFIVGYIQDPPGDLSDLVISASGGVELELIDPVGRRTGLPVNASAPLLEIPRSVYQTQTVGDDGEAPPDSAEVGRTLSVGQPPAGEYQLAVRAVQPGPYHVMVSVWTPGATAQPVAELTGMATPGVTASHRLHLDTADGNAPLLEPVSVPVNRPPSAAAGADRSSECAAPGGSRIELDGSASNDPEGDPLTFTWRGPFPEGGGTVTGVRPTVTLPVGQHAISMVVSDGRGGESQDTTSVVVVDSSKPVWAQPVPATVSAQQNSLAGAALVLPVPPALDGCDPVPVVSSDAPAVFPLGTTVVTFRAVDGAGNTTTATTLVTVADSQAPAITMVTASPARLWPPTSNMVPVTIDVAVNDVCDAAPVCRITAVVSSDSSEGCGGGMRQPDWQVTGTLTLDLRARRETTGPGRTYRVTVSCTDASGNTENRAVDVPVSEVRP